ncbi:MAG: DUF3368 domain-containing protein [Planctomycetes bacterium]|nr:DUF3368 domain-containing protein [Planctomycetota bacterium]
MPDVICNTSPLSYLHFLDLLDLLPALMKQIVVPEAVIQELRVGRERGLSLPAPEKLPWVTVKTPASAKVLPMVTDLGPGETAVLALALEAPGSVVILDDGAARRTAMALGVKLTGTLGILLDGKKLGRIKQVRPVLDELQRMGFRLDTRTRIAVLSRAGELV